MENLYIFAVVPHAGTWIEIGSDPSTYDPNADGYYDDTEPEQPAESFGNHRKTLFKVFFSILAIIAVIIYLVFTAGV